MPSKLDNIISEIKEVKDKGFKIIFHGLKTKFIIAELSGKFQITVSGPPDIVKKIQLEVENYNPNN